MSKIIKKIIFISLLFFNTTVLAENIECTYPSAELTIIYGNDGKINYNSNFVNSNYYITSYLFGTGASTNFTDQLMVDQELWKKYIGMNACPSQLNVCTTTEYVIDFSANPVTSMQMESFIGKISALVHIDQDYLNELREDNTVVNLGKRTLYILTDAEYQDSEISKYVEGVTWTNSIAESYDAMVEKCKGASDNDFVNVACSISSAINEANRFLNPVVDVIYKWFDGNEPDYSGFKFIDKTCNVVKYDGPYASFNINCTQLFDKILQHSIEIINYKNCSDNSSCKINVKSSIKKIEDEIKSQCSSILQNYNFTGGQKGCMEDCLKIKEILNDNKKGTDLYEDLTSGGHCGFSDRLLSWILNILKWIKYIIPAIVIILGIIDFIKAIASDKDDEMKKAQGRFVKRLIAAALIFIVPLIIEFVLDKMGFVSEGCGIINF